MQRILAGINDPGTRVSDDRFEVESWEMQELNGGMREIAKFGNFFLPDCSASLTAIIYYCQRSSAAILRETPVTTTFLP